MQECPDIPKTGRNAFHKYDYIEETVVSSTLRPFLAKYNIFIFASVIDLSKEGDTTRMMFCYTFVDGDTGEREQIQWAGEASDKGDKGIWKCYTGAHKYLLLKMFNLGTDQDPEKELETKPNEKLKPLQNRGPAKPTLPVSKEVQQPVAAPLLAGEVPLFDEPGNVLTPKGVRVKEAWNSRVQALKKAREIQDRIQINDNLAPWEQAFIDYGIENELVTDA